jgi:hypothetical protein
MIAVPPSDLAPLKSRDSRAAVAITIELNRQIGELGPTSGFTSTR